MSIRETPRQCRIFPPELPNRVRHEPKRSGEVKFYDALKAQLGSGWTVFYSVAWLLPMQDASPKDGEADFILAHPQKGILVLELKGGQIEHDGTRQQWHSTDRFGHRWPINPFQQVRTSKHLLLGKLRSLPALRGAWIDIGHAVVFPDTQRPKMAVSLEAPPDIIIGGEDMLQLQARIEEILAYWLKQRQVANPDGHGQAIIAELTKLIARSTTLPMNPLSIQVQEDEREIVRLTEEQFRFLDQLNRTRRALVGGCAGSGKTFLAVEKAKRLAAEGYRTLLICYNRPLAEHLAAVTAGVERLDVRWFHRLSSLAAADAGLPAAAYNDDDGAAQVLMDAMELHPELRYDAIIVDEGQDFKQLAWVGLDACLSSPRAIYYIFYDNHQLLYRDAGVLPTGLADIVLNDNIRNTQAICRVLSRHYQGESPLRPRGPAGRSVETHSCDGVKELQDRLKQVLQRLLVVEGFSAKDLVVLTPRSLKERSELRALKLGGDFKLVQNEGEVAGHQVLCATIHSFKGLERKVAIVAELDEDLFSRPDDAARLCYVAFSRPRTHLVLLATPGVLPELLSDLS